MDIDEVINGWTFDETIKTAESLMEVEKNMFKWDVIRHLRDFAETYREQLKEYQQLEEQGRFIKLSCKAGDTIWYVNEDDEYPIELEIDTISREDNKDTWYCVNDDVYGKFEFIDSDFGETVFLTESEAEEKLKKLRGGENE